jgi:hypothetical protein
MAPIVPRLRGSGARSGLADAAGPQCAEASVFDSGSLAVIPNGVDPVDYEPVVADLAVLHARPPHEWDKSHPPPRFTGGARARAR